MDISLKDGISPEQTCAPGGELSNGAKQSLHPPTRVKIPNARPSTGRLISPAQERRVLLRGRITRVVANCCIARLIVLATEDVRRPIVIYIDSPGGSAAAAMNIISTMNGIRCPVVTFARGDVLGAAAIIASHGLRGYRVAAPGCRFGLKVSLSKEARQESIADEPLLPLLAEILIKNTRQRQEEVLELLRSATPFGPQEAMRLGMIDAIDNEPIFPKMA